MPALAETPLGPLRLQWSRPADRWTHQLVDASGQPLLRSCEGGADELFGPSPAYQEMLVEYVAEGVTEFQLMGQSGKTIYSASARIDAAAGTLEFDCCARVKQATSARAVASYALFPGAQALLTWEPLPLAGETPSLSERSGELVIGWPQLPSVDAVRGTAYRWRYRFRLKG